MSCSCHLTIRWSQPPPPFQVRMGRVIRKLYPHSRHLPATVAQIWVVNRRQKNFMLESSSFFGSCVVAGALLFLITMVTLHLLRPDYNPLSRFLCEYAVGPFGFLGTAALYVLAATFLMLLAGLRLSVHPSGFLTASCVLLGVTVISLCVCAVFPTDLMPPDGSRPTFSRASFTREGITHGVSAFLANASLIAVIFTLPSAYKLDEKWRSFSHTALLLGYLILALFVVLILVPFKLKGLVQRGMVLVVLTWLLLTGLRL